MIEITAYYNYPIGTFEIKGSELGIHAVLYHPEHIDNTYPIPKLLEDCIQQLDEYFRKNRTIFDLKLNPVGTDFQKRVWNQLLEIPFGKSQSYKQLSILLGDVKAIRAVGTANGKNKINIIIPCHRVIGSDGKMVGYGGGIDRKEWLLKHEGILNQTKLF